MKLLTYKSVPILAGLLMGLMLTGCQQAPPTVLANPQPAASSTSEHSSTTNTETKQVETPATTPDSSVQTKTSQQTTTVEKKSE
jgi:hypothetical protein